MTFTVTGVFTSPTAMSAFTITMLSARPIPRNISTSSTWRPSSCTIGSAVNRPNTASALIQMSVDTQVVSATAMRSATHTRRATASNLPAPNRYPSTICVACDNAMEYR